MSKELDPKNKPGGPKIYQFRIESHLGQQWADWFGGMTLTLEEDGNTLLTGPVIDQAALYGLIRKIRDLGVPLVSIMRLQPGQADLLDPNDDCDTG